MKTMKVVAPLLALVLAAGCGETPDVPTEAKTSAAEDSAPAAPGIDAPIPSSDIDLTFQLVGGGTYDAIRDEVTYELEAANNGKATLISAGKLPIHLGVVVLGSDGTLQTPPSNQNFMRVPLPHPLEPGQRVKLPITFKVEPTLGGTVTVDAVQEQVSWFSGYGKPVLTIGTFIRCGGAEKTLCLADGTEVLSAR